MNKSTAYGIAHCQMTFSRPTHILFFWNTFSSYHNVSLDQPKINNGCIVMVYIKLMHSSFLNVDVPKARISLYACRSGESKRAYFNQQWITMRPAVICMFITGWQNVMTTTALTVTQNLDTSVGPQPPTKCAARAREGKQDFRPRTLYKSHDVCPNPKANYRSRLTSDTPSRIWERNHRLTLISITQRTWILLENIPIHEHHKLNILRHSLAFC